MTVFNVPMHKREDLISISPAVSRQKLRSKSNKFRFFEIKTQVEKEKTQVRISKTQVSGIFQECPRQKSGEK